MRTINGYTEQEIREMIEDDTIDQNLLISYLNNDYDGNEDSPYGE